MILKEKSKNGEKLKHHHRFWRSRARQQSEKEKRKRDWIPDSSFKTVVEWRLPIRLEMKRKDAEAAIIFAVFWLLLICWGTVKQIDEWNDWKILDERGETVFAPLVETGHRSCGRGGSTCYHAVYEYRNSEHRESISEEKYKGLSNETIVEIVAAGDISHIAGTRPDFTCHVVLGGILWMVGLVPLWWGISVLNKIRGMKKYHR